MKAVVACISFFDNEIKQAVVDVEKKSWKQAFSRACPALGINSSEQKEWIKSMPADFKEARTEFGQGEMDVSIVFIED